MKRKHVISIIVILIIIIILLYLTCQGRKEVTRPREVAEAPAVMPPERTPAIPPEVVKPDKAVTRPEEEALPEKEERVLVPEVPVETVQITPPEKDMVTEETIPEPIEEERVALPEEPVEQGVTPEVKMVTPEEPAETIEEQRVTAPGEALRTEVEEPLPVFQLDATVDPAGRIAILPFDNLTDNPEAFKGILPWIKGALADKGYDVVDEKVTGDLLCREGIRLPTDLPRESTRSVGKTLKASSMLAGTVFAYKTGKNPTVGISARLIDTTTGYIIWADYASDTGEDYTGLLGLGTITAIHKLIPKVVDQLLASFHIDDMKAQPESMYKVVVLPFNNLSKDRYAGMAVTHMFLVQLFKNTLFNPVEYGDVRKMILDLRIRHKGELSLKKLNDVSNALGAGIILTGTVEDFTEGIDNVYPPKVAISARLLDSNQNKIVWFDALTLDGEDRITAFEWGKLRSPDKVAYSVVSDLVKNMESAKIALRREM